jgi:nucleoside-diphosphate-sugar epimerase
MEKIVEERAVRDAHDRGRFGSVILRPGIVFGPGDRHATPQFLRALSSPLPFYVGRGDNVVASLAIEDLATAVARAATYPEIDGRCYTLAGREAVTQRDLFRIHARVCGRRPPRFGLPFHIISGLVALARRVGRSYSRPMTMTRAGAWVVGTSSPVSCAAASADLGWVGAASVANAIARSIATIRGPSMGPTMDCAQPQAKGPADSAEFRPPEFASEESS